MLVSNKKNFIFCPIGRTGTSNLLLALRHFRESPLAAITSDPKHGCMFELEDQINLENYYKFCFSRNPYDSAVSIFCYHFGRMNGINPPLHIPHDTTPNQGNAWIHKMTMEDARREFKKYVFSNDYYVAQYGSSSKNYRRRERNKNYNRFSFVKEKDIPAFLESSNNCWRGAGYLLRYASDQIVSRDGNTVLVDEIFKFEDLYESVQVLSGKIGIPIDLVPYRHSRTNFGFSNAASNPSPRPEGFKTFSDFYDEETRKKVYFELEKDFDIFKYPSTMEIR